VLIVPDGNWNQAQRMARRDPDARGALHVTLPAGEPSRYQLRRNPREGTLSTLEAIARALALLEGPGLEEPLLDLFDTFVTRSLSLRQTGKPRALREDL
jgi:DTW domain-containing protein YfiP